jgi:cell wall-associated NlpC family hydrolase
MKRVQPLAVQMESISRRFLGRPYKTNPLIGSADAPEVFTDATSGFDCVTYIEAVLARASSRNKAESSSILRQIRYQNGVVDWKRRNHYMTAWIRNNQHNGLVRQLRFGNAAIRIDRRLNMVLGLPSRRCVFTCVPKRSISKVDSQIQTGDLIFFASTRPQLDVFHCGILVRNGDRLRLRHASRTQSGVVEQDLSQFLKANRMAGILLARPVERVPH